MLIGVAAALCGVAGEPRKGTGTSWPRGSLVTGMDVDSALDAKVAMDIGKKGMVGKNSAKEAKATKNSVKVPKVLKGWTVKKDDDGVYIERPNACRYCTVSNLCQDYNVPNVCEDCRVDNRCEVCKKIAEEEKIKFNVK